VARAIRKSSAIHGRLSVHRDGYAFVIPDEPLAGIKGDIYISKDAANKGMHGDRVAVRNLDLAVMLAGHLLAAELAGFAAFFGSGVVWHSFTYPKS